MTRRELWGPALGTKYKYFEKIDDKLPLRLVWEAWGVIPKLMVKVDSFYLSAENSPRIRTKHNGVSTKTVGKIKKQD